MRYSVEDFAAEIGSWRRRLAGLVRRMSVKVTNGGVWQVAGHFLFDAVQRENPPVENYPGIGFTARPPVNTSAEGIVLSVGGANHPALVATRDEATRAAKMSDLAVDEAAAYNTLARVYIKADGTIEARTHAGTAVALAKHSDMVSLKTQFANWVVVAGDGGAALKTLMTTLIGTGWPFGTSKLKGE